MKAAVWKEGGTWMACRAITPWFYRPCVSWEAAMRWALEGGI